jgi:hypothetical protein
LPIYGILAYRPTRTNPILPSDSGTISRAVIGYPNKGEGMFWQRVRFALLAGIVAATATTTARAGDCCAPACSAPCTRTVCCTEWVPEQYQCTRTVYKTEYKQEAYTAYKCECYPETVTRTVTCYKSVPEVRTQIVNYTVCTPCVEEKTVMQACVTYKPVTKIVRKCVDQGHWECKEVPCEPSCMDRLRKCFHKSCCDDCCVKTKIVKCWVPCPVWVECPVTCMQRCCEYKPVVVKCCTYKTECRQKEVQVCCYKCVPETREVSCTVMKTKLVPYQATRCVAVCVPCTETVTCCRMVAKTVVKQVPVCESSCCTSCCKPCCK